MSDDTQQGAIECLAHLMDISVKATCRRCQSSDKWKGHTSTDTLCMEGLERSSFGRQGLAERTRLAAAGSCYEYATWRLEAAEWSGLVRR